VGTWIYIAKTGYLFRVRDKNELVIKGGQIKGQKMIIGKKSEPTDTGTELPLPKDASAMGAAIAGILARGACLTLFATRNRSAIAVRFMWGAFNETEYCGDWDAVDRTLESLLSQMVTMGEPPPEEPKKGHRTRLDAVKA